MDHAAPQDAHQSKVRHFEAVRSRRAPWRAQADSHVTCPPASSQQMILGYKYLLIWSTFITTVIHTEAARESVTVGCNQVLSTCSRIILYSSKHLWDTFTFTPLWYIYSGTELKCTFEVQFQFPATLYLHSTTFFLKANNVLTPLHLFSNFIDKLLFRVHVASEQKQWNINFVFKNIKNTDRL